MTKSGQRKRQKEEVELAVVNNKKKLKTKAGAADSDDGGDSSPKFISTSNKLQKLLEPYTKEQLIDLIANFSVSDSSLYSRICSAADAETTHRKIFVHGLSWDSTRETLVEAFREYGPIDECSAVMDRATGKCKGYGFVLFKSRKGASKALQQPSKMINNRMTHCQLASLGATVGASTAAGTAAAGGGGTDNSSRKIFVGNVHGDVDRDRLRDFFASFGDIESGPIGFDVNTGKSRGYALFVYKKEEGARKALQEPYKMFEGHQLNCQKASDNGRKTKEYVGNAPLIAQQHPPALSGPPNLLYNPQQYLGVNPFYGGIFMGAAPILAAGMMNPTMVPSAPAPAPAGFKASAQGNIGGSPSFLGPYGSSFPSYGLPQAFPSAHFQQPNSTTPRGQMRKR